MDSVPVCPVADVDVHCLILPLLILFWGQDLSLNPDLISYRLLVRNCRDSVSVFQPPSQKQHSAFSRLF